MGETKIYIETMINKYRELFLEKVTIDKLFDNEFTNKELQTYNSFLEVLENILESIIEEEKKLYINIALEELNQIKEDLRKV